MKEIKKNWPERNPKKAITFVIFWILLVSIILVEYSLRSLMGLGNPVLYDSNQLYGFRPLPNQQITRVYGSKLLFNNIGIRANADWDNKVDDKILFLGDSVTYGGSYISNEELFSYLALKGFNGYKSGNAGVNAWGIENIYGLIVESEFLPAKYYITTVIEGNFYRGLTRLQGLPYWSHKPRFALEELLYHFYYKQNNKRYRSWKNFSSNKHTEKVVEKAVLKLREMDEFLKSKGYYHIVYILPTYQQVLEDKEKDKLLTKYLSKYNLDVVYLIDKIKILNLKNKESWFRDTIHLEKEGHAIYGMIIGNDLKTIISKSKVSKR